MLAQLLGTVASSAASSAMGGGQKGSSTSDLLSTSNTPNVPINVAPVGLNLGSIISPATQGSPENGGSGLDYSRYIYPQYADNADIATLQTIDGVPLSGNIPLFLAGGAVIVGLFYAFRR